MHRPSQGARAGADAARPLTILICVGAAIGGGLVRAQEAPIDLTETLARVGARVEQFYGRAQSIVSLESVWIQPLRYDMTPIGFPRRLAYELRVAWDPDTAEPGELPEATVLRELVGINGRPPRPNDEPECMDPKPVSPEPLAMLLAARRDKFVFSLAGTTRLDGTAAVMIDYRGIDKAPPDIAWTEECVSITLPGRSRGRIWIDAATDDVLRLDEHLVGQFEFPVPWQHVRRGAAPSMAIERADSSIRFRRVAFEEPDEVLMVPAEIDSFQTVRGGAVQRTRIIQRFSDYRRFLTGGRIVR